MTQFIESGGSYCENSVEECGRRDRCGSTRVGTRSVQCGGGGRGSGRWQRASVVLQRRNQHRAAGRWCRRSERRLPGIAQPGAVTGRVFRTTEAARRTLFRVGAPRRSVQVGSAGGCAAGTTEPGARRQFRAAVGAVHHRGCRHLRAAAHAELRPRRVRRLAGRARRTGVHRRAATLSQRLGLATGRRRGVTTGRRGRVTTGRGTGVTGGRRAGVATGGTTGETGRRRRCR